MLFVVLQSKIGKKLKNSYFRPKSPQYVFGEFRALFFDKKKIKKRLFSAKITPVCGLEMTPNVRCLLFTIFFLRYRFVNIWIGLQKRKNVTKTKKV